MSSGTPKAPNVHGKQLLVDDRLILSLVNKKPLTTVGQIKNKVKDRNLKKTHHIQFVSSQNKKTSFQFQFAKNI